MVPLSARLQATSWPYNYRARNWPKYYRKVNPSQFIMSYLVVVPLRGRQKRNDEVIHNRPHRPTLTWYTRLPLLSIDSCVVFREKFLINFHGYMLQIDALIELPLCQQLAKESLQEYYNKFLSLKS